MQTVANLASKSLENFEKNEFRKILEEPISLDEKLTAIYLRSLQPDYFSLYRPKREPYPPQGWVDEYRIYESAKDSEKSAIWREMSARFSGYLKAIEDTRFENRSNRDFLKEMMVHFEKMQMPKQVEMIRLRLQEFAHEAA